MEHSRSFLSGSGKVSLVNTCCQDCQRKAVIRDGVFTYSENPITAPLHADVGELSYLLSAPMWRQAADSACRPERIYQPPPHHWISS
jgi:hypothetical protein